MSEQLLYADDGARGRVAYAGATPLGIPVDTLVPDLRGFVRRRLGDHADGDDVVQETFVRLLSYQTGARVRDVRALCFTIARNLLLDHHRAAKRHTGVALNETIPCPAPIADAIVAYRRAVALMVAALERMPPLRREVFLRRRLDGCRTADIAASLQMSPAAVEKHVVRALADLRAALARRGFTMAGGA